MKELIPFNEWSKEKIKQGKKICTSRHKKYLHDKRVYYITPKLPFWFIRKFLCQAEGADNETELEGVFTSIYNRHMPNDEEFYVHFGDFR